MAKTKWSISKLKNWEQNPRTISKENFERLKAQIKELGEYKPLLITKDGTVLGGNMRLRAYRELGFKEAWVSVVKADTEEQKLKYALSDNDQAGEYHKDDLANIIGNIPEIDLGDYSVNLGKSTPIEDLLPQEIKEDEAPEVADGESDSKLGDVYELGRHRLMCGDSTKIEDVEKLMDGKKADMVFTDPPYGIDLDTDYSPISRQWKDRVPFAKSKQYDKVIGDEFKFNFKDFEWLDCKEQFWWGANYYVKQLPDGGSWFVWDKTAGKTQQVVGAEFELLWSKQKHKQQMIIQKWSGVMGLSSQDTKKRIHPTQKPIQVYTPILKQYSKEENLIVDLFGGSGSTLIACEQTDRICRMLEIDEKYCDVIRKRYAKFVGKEGEWQKATPIIK